MQKILLVGAWFFGVTFILGGLGILFEGTIIGGLLMIVGAGLLLPPVKRAILDKKTNLSRGKITAIGSILILISYFFFPLFIPLDDEADSTPVATNSVETKEDVVAKKDNTKMDTPVAIKPVVEPNVEKTEIDKPVDVIKTAPSEPSTTEKRQDIDTLKVRAILDKIDKEVKEAKGFDIKNGVEVAKKSRRVNAINEEMMALAKEMPSIGSENGKVRMFCGIAVGEGAGYWRNVMFSKTDKDLETSKRLLKNYQESKGSCLDAIKEFENS